MALLTAERYRDLTGDFTTDVAEVTARIEEATEMLEDALDGRQLTASARTETVALRVDPCGGWRAYPKATPITAIPTDVAYRIEDTVTLADVSPADSPWWAWGTAREPTAEVTYTGGYTADTLPVVLARAIADLARSMSNKVPVSVPANATSAHVGDVSVTMQPGPGLVDSYVPGLSDRICKYRRRRPLA